MPEADEPGPTELSRQPHSGRWTILALLMLLSATQQFHRISLPAVGSQIMQDCSISEAAMGTLYSVFLFTYTLLMTPGGLFTDKVGAWWSLLLVIGGSGLFGAMTGGAGSLGLWFGLGPAAAWWWIAVARAGMGILSAPLYPSTARTVANWFAPPQRVFANSLVIGAALLGIAAAQKVMSLLGEWIGWQRSFYFIGAATVAVMAVWAVAGKARPSTPEPVDRAQLLRQKTGWTKLFLHPGIIALTLSYATVGYFEYLFFYWSKYYFKEILKLGEDESATYAMYPNLAMMVFTPLGGLACGWAVRRLGFRLGLRGMVMTSMTLAALFLALGALEQGLALKIAWLSLALGFIGASEGPAWTAAVHLGGPYGGAAAGFVNTGGNLLGILAPIATPRIAAFVNSSGWGSGDPLTGWTVALLAGSAVAIVGVIFWLWVDVDRPLR